MMIKIQNSEGKMPIIARLAAPYNDITFVTTYENSISVYFGDKMCSTITLQDSSISWEKTTSFSLNKNTMALTTEDKNLHVYSIQITKECNVSLSPVFKSSTPNITTASMATSTNSMICVILGDINGGISIIKYLNETKEISTTILDETLTTNTNIIPNKPNVKFIEILSGNNDFIRFVICSDNCLLKIYEFCIKESSAVLSKSIETGFVLGIDHLMVLRGNGVDSDYCVVTSKNEYNVVNLEADEIIKSETCFKESKEAETDESFFENGIGDVKDKEGNNIIWLRKDCSESVVYGKLENGELFDFEIE